MDTTQEFDKTNENTQQAAEDFGSREAEVIFSSFFGDFTEEEQNILREFGAKFNIRSNDAIWSIVGIFIIFGRINNKLPQKIKSTFANFFLNQMTLQIVMVHLVTKDKKERTRAQKFY